MNYVPNAAARTLKKRESKIVGVFLTDFKGMCTVSFSTE